MKDVVFIASAIGCCVLFGYKYRALRQAPPGRKRVILPVLFSSASAALGFLCLAPSVGVNLDRLAGIPNVSILGLFACSILTVCGLRIMIVNWRYPLERALRTTRWTLFAYGLVIATLITFFALGPTVEEHHHDFVPVFATTPYLAEFMVLFFVVYVASLINITYLCLKWAHDARANQTWLRRRLRLTSLGIQFPIAYGVISLATVVGGWFGADLYNWGVKAPYITGLGVPLCVAGHHITTLGAWLSSIRDRVAQHRADLRDYRRLGPLWRTLKPVDPAMVHTPDSLRERVNFGSRLFFRVIEINDWLHQLHAYRDPRVAETMTQRGRELGLATDEILAAQEAVQIRAALAAKTHGRTADRTTAPDQRDSSDETRHAFASECTRLVLTARAMSSPFVNDALRSVTIAHHPGQR